MVVFFPSSLSSVNVCWEFSCPEDGEEDSEGCLHDLKKKDKFSFLNTFHLTLSLSSCADEVH